MEKTDEQLASESILDKQGSFDELVHRYTRPIYNFTYRLCGNVQMAEDCTQETFIKVWKNLKKYTPSRSFRAWIFTIARNTTTDYLRKKKTVPFSSLSYGDTPFEDSVSDTDPLPEEFLSRIEDAALLERFLDELPIEARTVILLHYQENMTFEEIGIVMGKPMNTVKSWHRRALAKLREAT